MTTFQQSYEAALEAVKNAEAGERQIEARGSCQACFEQFVSKPYSKMKKQSRFTGEPMNYKPGTLVMVKHGFTRPGHGYLVGECWGVGHPPFELDSTITKHWRQYLVTDLLPSTKQKLSDLKSGKIKVFAFEISLPRRPDQSIWVKLETRTLFLTEGKPLPSEWTDSSPPNFAWARQKKIRETEQDIKEISADIEYLGKAISSWKYSPEKLAPKGKPLTEGQSIRQWFNSSADELKKLRAPEGGPGKGTNFYEWARNFPTVLAWTSMRTGDWNPSYYKYIRSTYERMTGSKPLAFESAPRVGEIISREKSEKLTAQKAKLEAREAAQKIKTDRSNKAKDKAVLDIEMFRKAYAEVLDNERLMTAFKGAKKYNPYSNESTTSVYDFVIDLLKRYHYMPFIKGEQTAEQFVYGDKNADRYGDALLNKRRDLREIYGIIRDSAKDVGFKLKAL